MYTARFCKPHKLNMFCVYIFQLMIEGVCGAGANGDIGVDDISMIAKSCSEIKNGNYYVNY